MREIVEELLQRYAAGESVGLGTVVQTFNSSPRGPGAAMLVAGDGTVAGSVSGGCVEGDVYAVAEEVLRQGHPELRHYGVSDDEAFSVGLTCGGLIDVFVEPVDRAHFPDLELVVASIRAEQPVATATVVEHPEASLVGRHLTVWPERARGSLGSRRIDDAVTGDAIGLLAAGRSTTLHYGPDGQRRGEGLSVFVNSFEPAPRMIVFGAIDFAAAMVRIGAFLGYRVTVCDARAVFATAARFPDADEVVVRWPHEYLEAEVAAGRVDQRTAVAVLTHDPKFDLPLLEVALSADLGYVGAMGSRRTHQQRVDQLQQAGVSRRQLSRLASPIGLDLGARTPQETAVSIAAEIVALRWGGDGSRLGELTGPIHHGAS